MSALDEPASPPVVLRTDSAALLAGLVTVNLWGSAFVAIRAAGDELSPGAIALGRLLVSTVLLAGVALVRRQPLPRRRDLRSIAIYGVLWLGVYSVSLNAAERRVDAGTAAMFINTGPILIAILAGLFLGEGFPRRLYVGCAVAFAGTVIIGFGAAHAGSRSLLGVALLAVAALAYATAVIVQKPILSRVSALQVTWLSCAAATVACLPFAPRLASEAAAADAGSIAWVVYLGVMPTALGFVTWSFALRRTSAGRMASLTYLIPVVAVVLGWIVLDETPPWLAVPGGALCLAGVAIARRR
jgi:drug/metabolite transporter (DMT)-like permease